MSRPTQHRLKEAVRYATNMSGGRSWEVSDNGWAAHLAGSVNSCLPDVPAVDARPAR